MREFTVTKNDAGQRLDRWLGKTLPLLPTPLAQKYIRLKRVKVNGKGSKRDAGSRPGTCSSSISTTSSSTSPGRTTPSSRCSGPGWRSSTRMKT